MAERTPELTPAERRILQLMIRGQNASAIASALCIERSTVKRHRQNLYYKSATHDAVALVCWGRGWLQNQQRDIERALNPGAAHESAPNGVES